MEESIGDVSAFSLLLPGQNGSYLEHPCFATTNLARIGARKLTSQN